MTDKLRSFVADNAPQDDYSGRWWRVRRSWVSFRSGATKRNRKEAGAALLIAIFALLLISVIAIALVVSSGTESALQSNYRTSTGAYYAALAGVEEARGRLLPKNPDALSLALPPGYFPDPANPTMPLYSAIYIINPNVASGETVDPTALGTASSYPDTEFQTEFAMPITGATVNTINSVSSAGVGAGPLYKWVRITGATEKSLSLDVDNDGDKTDGTTLLYYDSTHISAGGVPKPGLVKGPTPNAKQALEITALAVYPPNTQKMLQYVVVPLVISPSTLSNAFPAALTLDGTLDGTPSTFQHPPGPPGPPAPPPSPSSYYQITGVDACGGLPVAAISTTNAWDRSAVSTTLSPSPLNGQYSGAPMLPPPTLGPTKPSVNDLSVPAPSQIRQNWQNPATLEAVVQDITKNADVVITGSATGADISSRASTMVDNAAGPMTLVINGDLDLNGWHHHGYGLLLVTGTVHYDPDAYWHGIVLIIGQGVFSSQNNGSGKIEGAMLVAKTRDSSGNLLTTPTLGPAFFGSLTSYGSNPGYGVLYNSCLVQSAQGPLAYKVLSFREIPFTN